MDRQTLHKVGDTAGGGHASGSSKDVYLFAPHGTSRPRTFGAGDLPDRLNQAMTNAQGTLNLVGG